MNIKEYLFNISKPLHQQVYDNLDITKDMYFRLQDLSEKQQKDLIELKELCKYKDTLLKQKDDEIKRINDSLLTPIEKYAQEQKWKKIANFAYKNKRKVGNEYIAMYLNQLITPNAFVIVNMHRAWQEEKDLYKRVKGFGDWVAKKTTWVNEQKLYESGDYYLYPEETITGMKDKTDCEDVSNVICSFESDSMAVCYGMYYNNNGSSFGHAFPIMVYNKIPYIVETTGDSVEIVPFTDKRYEAYFIITKDSTYKVKDGIEFGELVGWTL